VQGKTAEHVVSTVRQVSLGPAAHFLRENFREIRNSTIEGASCRNTVKTDAFVSLLQRSGNQSLRSDQASFLPQGFIA